MSGMFDNFTHVNTTMRPGDVSQKYPSTNAPKPNFNVPQPNKPYENRSMDGTLKGYFWYYGNSIDLVFSVDGTVTLDNGYYMEAADVLTGMLITFNIFDHRRVCVMQFSNSDIGMPLKYTSTVDSEGNVVGEVTISLSHDQSLKLPKGVYTCSLTASHESGYYETLFDTDTCTFEVR